MKIKMTVTIQFNDIIEDEAMREQVSKNIMEAVKRFDATTGVAPKESGTFAQSVNVKIKSIQR